MTPREKLMAVVKHPAFHDACEQAARRAYDFREEGRTDAGYNPPCFAVYFDGAAMFVRRSTEDQPTDSVLVCMAQHWNRESVMLRFHEVNSTRTEFRKRDANWEDSKKQKLA
jgi:hypothetical protein